MYYSGDIHLQNTARAQRRNCGGEYGGDGK
jgi:hypothetical protein